MSPQKERKDNMRSLLVVIISVCLISCATLTYKAPNGTEVIYSRFLTTSELIEAKIGEAQIKSKGQAIDPAVLQAIIGALLQASK
jgi:hypothetical protein